MSRHTATATPAINLWASMESAARAAVRHFAVQPEDSKVLATLEQEQNLIRQSSRHWLVG